jgi:hypothetical protein
MPGCYPPPALSNYSSATDLQLKGLGMAAGVCTAKSS